MTFGLSQTFAGCGNRIRTSHNCDGNITSAELRPGQAQGFTAKQYHGLGFYFADVAPDHFRVGQVTVAGVTENYVRFVKESLMWLRGNRANGDLPATLR